ncbi:MAG TPA: hemolysin family protein [Candidatus Sulfomarinibacteraceae bacterium]|nr:hemolysin family protein [Candidatus Sulfomarinibacteraceae bacterium]
MSKLLLVLGLPGIVFFFASILTQETPPDSSLFVVLLVILFLVLLNGLFVAAEFSIIGVRASRVEQLVLEGNKRARNVLDILNSNQRQDRYIATAQVGITLASLGLGMYGEPQIARFVEPTLATLLDGSVSPVFLHSVAFVISLSFVTYLHVVIGEMVPKSLALSMAERSVLWLSRPMALAQSLLSPAVRGLNAIGNALLRLLRVPPAHGHQRLHSPEELELIVSESAEGGLLNEEEEEMILNIFDFSDRQVGQVMTPRRKVQAIPHDLPLDELLQLVARSNYSRFPVFEEDLDHVIGILHLKDLVHQRLRSKGSPDIRLILRPAPAVPEYQPVEKLLAAFKRQRIHMAIVLDEFGGMAGIVTLEDLIEEVVGEVRDEFDVEREPITFLEPGVMEVAGNYLLDDLTDHIYLGDEESLPDVETVGGLIVTALGRPPRRGDEFAFDEEVRFSVLDVDGLAVSRARIEYPVMREGTESASSDDGQSRRYSQNGS